MKNRILLAINPEYVDKILDGSKKYEYRKTIAKKNINSILIYKTHPYKEIVAEVQIIKILATKPNKLWNETKYSSGISKSFFNKYFFGRDIAYAYQLGKIKNFKKPKKLSDYGIKFTPQSFIYV